MEKTTASTVKSVRVLKEKTKTPSFIKLRDKLSFILGIANVALTAFIIGRFPDAMPLFYTIKSVILLSLRLYLFRKEKMHYYLFDFCYYANLLVIIYIHFFPQNETLFMICWAFSNGPLAWAILTWRNSLVLHSLSRTTSVFIHITPALVLHSLRWYANSPESLSTYNTLRDSSPNFFWATLFPLVPYLIWQTLYIIKVEVLSGQKVEERDYETSFRYLRESKGFVGDMIRKFKTREQQLMAFIGYQFIYTILTILPVTLYHQSFYLHTGFLLLMFFVSLWNGSNYYFEVFATRYTATLAKMKEREQEGQKEAQKEQQTSTNNKAANKND